MRSRLVGELVLSISLRAMCPTDFPPTALQDNPSYVKALLRRAQAGERIGSSSSLEKSLSDYTALLQLDPTNRDAKKAASALPQRIKQTQEKERTEMMGKLKELGNGLLGKFGLSTDNFQMVQDPATGSYSINFKR